jgi:hypothetical protein
VAGVEEHEHPPARAGERALDAIPADAALARRGRGERGRAGEEDHALLALPFLVADLHAVAGEEDHREIVGAHRGEAGDGAFYTRQR